MRTLLHLSDLHFGRVDGSLLAPLLEAAKRISPHLTVISGDLTQRARKSQFLEAKAFLQRLAGPKLIVPGNHDVPLYNVFARFAAPLQGYKRHISDELCPYFVDDELAVHGINTARSFTRDRGSINSSQVQAAAAFFREHPHKIKVVVTHHPFDIPENLSSRYMVRKAAEAMDALGEIEADLFLSGHAHLCFAESSIRRYKTAKHASLIVQAGTGLSTRTRDTPNSFNVLRIERPKVCVEHWMWKRTKLDFVPDLVREFHHGPAGWAPSG